MKAAFPMRMGANRLLEMSECPSSPSSLPSSSSSFDVSVRRNAYGLGFRDALQLNLTTLQNPESVCEGPFRLCEGCVGFNQIHDLLILIMLRNLEENGKNRRSGLAHGLAAHGRCFTTC